MRDAAIIVLDGGSGATRDGVVTAGDFAVFHLAVCRECAGMVIPFATRLERNAWAAQHPHEVAKGIELRNA